MLLLSIDVGIRNLAYIILEIDVEYNTDTIIEWNNIELCDSCENASKVDNVIIGININKKFSSILEKYTFDKIIIENQIGKNAIKMKSIQNMLVMYFIMKDYDETQMVNYNAVNKLKYYLEKKKTTYAERKKLSKLIVKELCNNIYTDWLEYFNKSKKKDDLSDCLLQVLDYTRKFKLIKNSDENKIVIKELV
uniref:Holliday Junction Resolvase n=1 Tax=Florenciella sp. virus SA2 TaxID=3240092 RepID=A0AB39JBF7_9VIRU